MCSKGVKRSLSDSDDDDYANSPELLLPFKDPYSSDENQVKSNERSNCAEDEPSKESNQNLILHKIQDSSKMLAEHVQYFFYIDFIPIEKEVNLEHASLEECLFHTLRFTSAISIQTNDETNIHNLKINGQTTYEICEHLEQTIADFTWIKDNDKHDFRDLSNEDIDLQVKFFGEHAGNWACIDNIFRYSRFMITLLELHKKTIDSIKCSTTAHHTELPSYESKTIPQKINSNIFCFGTSDDNAKNLSKANKKADVIQSLLVKEYLEVIADFLDNRHYKRNDKCRKNFNLVVNNPDLANDNDLIEERSCVILVQPDGVVVGPPSDPEYRLQGEEALLLVIHAYEPPMSGIIDTQNPGEFPSPMDEIENKNSSQTTVVIENTTNRRSSAQPSVCSEAAHDIPLKSQSRQSKHHHTEENNIKQQHKSNPLSTSLKNHENQHPCVKASTINNSPSSRSKLGQEHPAQNYNMISDTKYCESLKNKILASIPVQCSAQGCVNKIAGQHVLELFSMAHETFLSCEQKTSFYNSNGTKCAKAIGFFIVNEFVYFSKLLVEDYLIWYLVNGQINKRQLPKLIAKNKEKPRMCYGNFRLDLTIANHRKTFIFFLYHIIRNNKFLKY